VVRTIIGGPESRLNRLLDEILERHGLRGRWDQWTKLARLPIERKLEILLDLQRTVNEIARAVGRPTKAEWPREILPRPEPRVI